MNKANLTHRISRAALILVLALFSATTAWASVITLDENTGEVTLQNGDVLTGTGGENTNVKIADGATVTLSGVNITAYYGNSSHQWAGISCLGDAVIVLYEGTTNNVKGGGYNPGIFVPQGHTLTLQGGGTLNATGSYGGAGIGSVDGGSCGAITISGGTVTANGGQYAAGIGSGNTGSSGNITISDGTVTANGGGGAAGIGNGEHSSSGDITISGGTVNATGIRAAGIGSGYVSSCGTITISGGIVTANGGQYAAGIGSGSGYVSSSCGTITISGGIVTANGGYGGAGIGSGYVSSCGTITISGGIVTANGGYGGAGIGSGGSSSCGTVTITNNVIMVIATKGNDSPNTIGAGNLGSCGTVTIGGVTGSITQSPYAYIPNLVTLTPQSEEVTLQNGTVLNGTGGENTRVKIADGATVVLYGVDITAYYNTSSNQRPGISCLGDAVIVLYEGTTNNVKGGGSNPGIFVPQGHTLTLQGGGTLNATGGEKGAGIGSSYHSSCGNITISSGTVNANGGEHGAGIGSSNWSSFGNITISGGTVNANGGQWGAGIGSGCITSSCETITISGGTVTATGGQNAAGIGSGYYNSSCGAVTISGGTVTANGGQNAAGIGSGYKNSSCENITITNGVTMVTTTAGQDCDNAIGAGTSGSTCGTVTIGGVETGFITQSPFTTYPYTVSFDANGGTGTMANQGFMYGVAQNLTASSLTNWGHSLEGWATSANGPKVYDDGQSVSNLTQTPGATVTLYAKWITDISVDGDEYTIYTSTGWDLFCDLLADNSNGYFTGKTVKLDADISVTRMAGGSDHAFSGTFDGQGHTLTVSYTTTEQYTAPFRYVNGATITNLVTAGTISTSKKFASGMIGGTLGGAVSITNCKVDVTINSSINGDGTHGGFVALASYGTLNITGCTFSGEMLGENTINCGGFVGWTESNNNATTTITDCLFAPTTLEISSGRTFSRARNMSSVTITNCYYTEPLGTAQGIQAVSDPAIQPTGNPTATYDVSGITTYANGMLYGTIFYFDPAHLSVDGDEYTIHTTTGWDMFCDMLANNSSGYFTGKTVKLNADISVTRMAGDSDHAFSGTFDGQGHTLTMSYTTTEQYTAPFRYVNGATITNLVTAGTISTSKKFASGMIGGTLGGAVSITNCKVDVTINSSINGDGTHGGFVALASYGTLNITGCTFSGEMLGENTINCGGFVGWTESNNSATATFTDCLFAPTTLEISSGRTFARARNMSSVTLTNCYYTEPLGTAQGIQGVSNPAVQPTGDPTATYSVSGITIYTNGMLYGETFYYNPNMNFVLDIEGYGYESNPGGWYLIASPFVEAIAPSEENGFLSNEYDLYYFDQSFVGEEWRNYKDNNFLLTSGKGYLYASEQATTLVFTGTPYTGDGEIELAYNPNVPDFAGWNLVGNPFAETAYVDRDFYVMNSTGTEIIPAEGSTVEAMEGIFVVADQDGETMAFSTTTSGAKGASLALDISQSRGAVVDRAIVRFGEGKQLPKFQIDPSHTKVYIPMDGKDYAVVRSESMGELPVNFKAEHNGTYTLTFSTENVDFDYLHLIDNLTGADVDLLVPEPVEGPASYTFTAKTTDYESRFKLVFSTNEDGPSTGSVAFAFINNGNIIVNGEGTVQVIDMMGHVVYQGNAINRVSTGGMTPGVYILRLIDGDNVWTQKIVIE